MKLSSYLAIDKVVFGTDDLQRCVSHGECCQCGKCCIVTNADVPATESGITFSRVMEPCPHLVHDQGRFSCGVQNGPKPTVCSDWNGNTITENGDSNFVRLNAKMLESLLADSTNESLVVARIRLIEKMQEFGLIYSKYDASRISRIWLNEGRDLITIFKYAFRMNPFPERFFDAFEFRTLIFATTLNLKVIFDDIAAGIDVSHLPRLRSVLFFN